MKIADEEWQVLSSLLDEALDLPASARAAWLDDLDERYAGLKTQLRDVLANQALVETADFLGAQVDLGALDAARRPAAGPAGLSPQTVVGPYRLIRELGRGGMGTVWLADRPDGLVKRSIALKLPHPSLYDEHLAGRFSRERDILAALAHPNIARLYDAGVAANGQPYLALEYVEGSPLTVYCDKGRLPVRERIMLFLQVLDAIQYAHAHLVIHRDIKPSNILVGTDGKVRLLDFGVAKLVNDDEGRESKLTQVSGRALTPDYASPEQIAGAPISTASDIYSLGVVLYELLAAVRPYALKRESRGALEEAILGADPERPSQAVRAAAPKLAKALAGDLDTIVLKALKKTPPERYASVDAFTLDLRHYLQGEPVEARPDSALYKLGKFAVRNKLGLAAASFAALALAAGTVVSLWQARAARTQAAVARREADRAKAVQDFLVRVFSANSHLQADPIKARQTTARELLEQGASQIRTSLMENPEARAEVLSTLGDMYSQMGLDAQASAINLERIAALKQAYGPNDWRVAEGIFQYTRDIANSNERAKILPALNEAEAILDAGHDQTSRTRAALWLEYAHYYRYTAPDRMRSYADLAVKLLEQRYRHDWLRVLAMKEAARARFELGDYSAAEAQFKDTLTATHQIDAGPSAWEIAPLAQIAGVQAELLEFDAAERNYRASLALSQKLNGNTHSETLQSASRLGGFLYDTARLTEGRRLLSDAMALIDGDPSKQENSVAAVVYGLYGQALAADGDFEAAARLLTHELDFVRRLYPESTLLARALLHTGEVDTALGRYDAAAEALDQGGQIWLDIAGKSADPSLINPFVLARARLDLARGNPEAAIARLSQLRPHRSPARLPLAVDEIGAQIIRAQAQLSLQRPGDAADAAREALERVAGSPLRDRLQALEASAALELGRALERSGNFAQARPRLERAVQLRQAGNGAASPWVAEAQIALANCLLDLGDQHRARLLLDEARAAIDSHVELGPHFKNPELELRLRLQHARFAAR